MSSGSGQQSLTQNTLTNINNAMQEQVVPGVTFRIREDDEQFDLNSKTLFADKTVVVFSLPGAFTPTCPSTHLPRYNELAGVLGANALMRSSL